MHELSLCGAIAQIAARRADGRPVQVVHIQVGQLRQVVPDSLTFCWEMVTAGTELDGSTLDIDHVRARLACRTCGEVFELGSEFTVACRACGGLDVSVETGEECDVVALDLAIA